MLIGITKLAQQHCAMNDLLEPRAHFLVSLKLVCIEITDDGLRLLACSPSLVHLGVVVLVKDVLNSLYYCVAPWKRAAVRKKLELFG
jgi:hypothetical protein